MLIAALLAVAAASADAAFPGRSGGLVYAYWGESVTYDEDSGDVFTDYAGVAIRAGGQMHVVMSCSEAVEPACGPSTYGAPAVSPDGRIVALRVGESLALVAVGGGGAPRLLSHPGSSWDSPAFSPGGRRLAFTSSSEGLAPRLWVSDIDGARTSDALEAIYGIDWQPLPR